MMIRIVPNDKGSPIGKLADAEMHFEDGPLAGLQLGGFAVWERRSNAAARNVTFPARQYSINGERRSFALLRPSSTARAEHYTAAQDRVRDLILSALASYEATGATTYRPAPTPAQVRENLAQALDAAQAAARAQEQPQAAQAPATLTAAIQAVLTDPITASYAPAGWQSIEADDAQAQAEPTPSRAATIADLF